MLLCSLMACTKPGREAASAPHATRLPAIAAVSSRCAYALSFAAPVACPLSPCLRSDVNKTLGQYSFRVVKPESHLEERCLRGSQPTRVPYFTNSISVGRQGLVEEQLLLAVGGAEISYALSASTGTPSHFAAAARSVNSETCSGEWSVNMACNFA